MSVSESQSSNPTGFQLMTWESAVMWLRSQPNNIDLLKVCYYDDPLMAAAERFWGGEEWCAVRHLLPRERGEALDLGAGRGISSYALARDGWRVTALEPDPSNLVGAGAIHALALESGLKITVVGQYAENLPFDDESFDVVNCRQLLHHASDLPRTCSEIFRVLRPGGMLIATREHVISRQEDLQAFLDSHLLHRFYGGERAYLLDEYRSAIRSAGFEITKTLAPHDSPINFFPLSEAQHILQCVRSIKDRLGRILVNRIIIPGRPMGKVLFRALVALVNKRDQTPGRLYSFVAIKPVKSRRSRRY